MSEQEVNDQQGDVQPSGEMPIVSPGALLAEFRKERGWTVEQVASQLNLAPRQIVAIESDDYPSLPGMPIVRGFIRAYAKLLKVEPAPLLATLGGETVLVHESISPRKTLSTPFSEARLPSMTERQPMLSKWVIGGLLVVLLGVAIWAARQGFGTVEPAKPVPSAESAVSQASAHQQVAPVEPVQGQQDAPAQQSLPVQAPADAQAPVMAADPAKTPGSLPSVPVSPAIAPSQVVPSSEAASGKDALVIKAREDSWIEIRRAGNNAPLLSRIVKAGETESVEINESVSIVIGNAAGVDMSLRGAPVEVKAKTNSNVAHLSLK